MWVLFVVFNGVVFVVRVFLSTPKSHRRTARLAGGSPWGGRGGVRGAPSFLSQPPLPIELRVIFSVGFFCGFLEVF